MSFSYWLSVAAAAVLPLAAFAETNRTLPDPADAGVSVNTRLYVSAFKDYRPAANDQETPDKTWRASNDTTKRLGGHAGHMKSVKSENLQDNHPATSAGKGK